MEEFKIYNLDYYFLYFIGESTASVEIRNEAKEFFQDIGLNDITLIILHTLVTFETALELKTIFEREKRTFKNVKSILIPATEYNITKYVVRKYDSPQTVIKIIGGSWINAAAINSEVRNSRLIVLKTNFKEVAIKNVPEDWNLKCKECGENISIYKVEKYQEIFPEKEKYAPICSNQDCMYYNKDSMAITDNVEMLDEDISLKTNLIEVIHTESVDLGEAEEILQNMEQKIQDYGNVGDIVQNIEPTEEVMQKITPETRDVPQTWDLRCISCDHLISQRLVEVTDKADSYFTCNNPNCVSFNEKAVAYTLAPPGMKCWKCFKDIFKYQVFVYENERELEYRPYCSKCNEPREKIIKLMGFDEI